MSSTTCAGGGGLASGKPASSSKPKEAAKKPTGELWGRRQLLRSREHKGAGAVLAGLGGKTNARGNEKKEAEGAAVEKGAGDRGEATAVASPGALRSALANASVSGSGSGPVGARAGACGLVTGEATPAMLYWEHKGLSLLPRWLACAHPTVKLIVTLRDPVQVFFLKASSHKTVGLFCTPHVYALSLCARPPLAPPCNPAHPQRLSLLRATPSRQRQRGNTRVRWWLLLLL